MRRFCFYVRGGLSWECCQQVRRGAVSLDRAVQLSIPALGLDRNDAYLVVPQIEGRPCRALCRQTPATLGCRHFFGIQHTGRPAQGQFIDCAQS